VPSIWRDPTLLTFIDEDNRELGVVSNPEHVPRVGENVRLAGVPYLVERVGYDIPDKTVERIWVVCRPA
jgi:hypothetical protein